MPAADLSDLIDRSAAAETFREAVRQYADVGRADGIQANPGAPPVKVVRVLTQLLAAEPALPVERVELHGRSGCSDFTGQLVAVTIDGARHGFAFTWDCAWRAREQGWQDWFGLPDQMRAAREYGWDCFEEWVPVAGESPSTAGQPARDARIATA